MDSVSFKRLNVPPTPPSILPVPFNTLTLKSRVAPGAFTNTDIHRYLNDLLQVRKKKRDIGFELKIKRCKLWCVSGDSLSVEFHSVFGDNYAAEVIVSHPGRNQWARLGIEWPRAQQERIVVSSGVFFQLLSIYSNNPSAKIILHFSIAWRIEKTHVVPVGFCLKCKDEVESASDDFEFLELSDSEDVLSLTME